MSFWEGKKVLVTGGNGFLGSFIIECLISRNVECFIPSSSRYDLTKEVDTVRLFDYFKPSIVIHAAACGGGIGFLKEKSGEVYYKNTMMNTLVMEYARQYGVQKFVSIGTASSYPKDIKLPFSESQLWQGYPEDSTAAYGMSKRMMIVQSKAYKEQYDFNSINLLLVNLYGPRDKFNLDNAHVIAALINKCVEAKRNNLKSINIWGDGSATREFIYVEDAAEAVLHAAEHYNDVEPVNIGSGVEISIKALIETICDIIGYNGYINWDISKPNGPLRRCVDVTKAAKEFGFRANTSLQVGLRKTIKWYCENI